MEDELKSFIEVLRQRLVGRENNMGTLIALCPPGVAVTERDLSMRAVCQAHINELEFIIEQLEEILDS